MSRSKKLPIEKELSGFLKRWARRKMRSAYRLADKGFRPLGPTRARRKIEYTFFHYDVRDLRFRKEGVEKEKLCRK